MTEIYNLIVALNGKVVKLQMYICQQLSLAIAEDYEQYANKATCPRASANYL